MRALLYLLPIFIVGPLVGAISLTLQLKNPGLTQTQLFLRHWRLYVGLIVALLAALACSIVLLLMGRV